MYGSEHRALRGNLDYLITSSQEGVCCPRLSLWRVGLGISSLECDVAKE